MIYFSNNKKLILCDFSNILLYQIIETMYSHLHIYNTISALNTK